MGAVAALAVAATCATARVNPAIYAHALKAPLAWAGVALFLGGLGMVFSALRRGRALMAFLGSGAFILGILAATAACVWPVMLRSTLDPAFSLDAFNASAGAYGLKSGLKWWLVGFPLALGYFAVLFRLHRGKVGAGGY